MPKLITLSNFELILKEALYAAIVKGREFRIKVARVPKNALLTKNRKIVERLKPVIDKVLEDSVIREILQDKIVGLEEFSTFVKRVEQLLAGVENINPHKVAVSLAMDLMGFGPLGYFLLDPEVEEVVVNGPQDVFVFKNGQYHRIQEPLFMGTYDIYELVDQIAYIQGKTLDENEPFLNANLPDGSRVLITIPPVTPRSPTITIRKYKRNKFSILDLIRYGTITPEAAAFLWVAVEGLRMHPFNILVVGGTASGKTTFLNALIGFIPQGQRVITIEDIRELYVPHENKVHMLSYGNITLNDLLINALRMRPDRIIVGEVRGKEAITLFQAMNVGHRGTMGTLHANSARECKERLTHSPMNVPEDMLPLVDLYVVLKKFPDGSRKVVEIVESQRGENVVAYAPIYKRIDGELKRVGSFGRKLEILAEQAEKSVKDVLQEIERRKAFLEQLLRQPLTFDQAFVAFNEYFS